MKIGIVTQPLQANYGGILQNYALQEFLRQLGHTPITIDRANKQSKLRWVLHRIKTIILQRDCQWRFPTYGRDMPRGFYGFVKKHITRTHFVEEIKSNIIEQYGLEALIVGSDQVWRPRYNTHFMNQFFDFAVDYKIPKIAYAASFGTNEKELTMDQVKQSGHLISDFVAISVRESSGVSLCRQYWDVDAVHVLDPTLLLERKQYEALCNGKRIENNKYIFAYILDPNPQRIDQIQQFAQHCGLEVRYKFDKKKKNSDTIEEWLCNICDAEYVITDSFHGTVFSLQFGKPFFVYSNDVRGNSRIESLLSMLDLSSRSGNNLDGNVILQDINWVTVSRILQSKRKVSIDFLIKYLSNRN